MRRFELSPGLVWVSLIFPAGIVIVSPVLFILEAFHVRTAMSWTLVCYFYLLPAYTYWRHKSFEPIDNAMAWGLPFLWGCFGTLVLLFTVPPTVWQHVEFATWWLWQHVLVNIIGYGLGLGAVGLTIAIVVTIARSFKRSY